MIKLKTEKFASYDVWGVEIAPKTLKFKECKKEYVVAVVGAEYLHNYAYYRRYNGSEYYKLSPEELEWMQFSGEEIPF